MDTPLHAGFYADHAEHHAVEIVEQEELARETYRIRFACPSIARRVLPGQFMMVRQPGSAEPLLGRAFALYDIADNAAGEAHFVDIVFHSVGKLTQFLSQATPGTPLALWGPLGNGFLPQPTPHLIMVAGGIGQTPFLTLAQEYLGRRDFGRVSARAERVSLCYGARSKDYFAGISAFESAGVEVRLATDDGSLGVHGLVTDVLEEMLIDPASQRVVTCGPEPMMAAVAELCARKQVPCQVSLETPMACGIGICFSCVAKVRQPDGSWDYKRTCVEGPVFDGQSLVWK